VPPDSTILVQVQVGPDGVELPTRYEGGVILDRRLTVLGESISNCTVDGQGQSDALTLGPGAAGSTVRRLSLIGASDATDPVRAALWVYGAPDVTVSNCLLRGNNNGARLEEATGLKLHNLTVVRNGKDAVYGSFAQAELNSSIVRENAACDVFFGAADPGQGFGLLYDNFTGNALCGVSNAGIGATTMSPQLIDGTNWFLDLLSQQNLDSGFVDGASVAIGLDVDRTAPDRGAYGGPWGEVHYGPSSPTPVAPPYVALALALGIGVLFRKRIVSVLRNRIPSRCEVSR
jgi:hypothetical protein